MSDSSTNLSLPYLIPSQAQKHVTHNEALAVLDTVVQLAVVDRDRTVPPAIPAVGGRHIVAAGAIGAWAGREGNVAVWEGTSWRFLAPQSGWHAWVMAEAIDLIWRDGIWGSVPLPALDNLEKAGVNTTADAVNRLAVAAEATLLTHDGAGHQLKINKSTPGETASLLFQSGWSGRAEMGLAGNDDWSLKVSPNGAAWTEALALDSATGLASGAAVQVDTVDATVGRLLRVGAFGLGGIADSINSSDDYNDYPKDGRFIGHASGSGQPFNGPPETAGMAGVQSFSGTTRGLQIVGRVQGSPGRVFSRAFDMSSWSSWTLHYTQATVLGTVSQSGGDPTGALIERGSNANGEYAKFADGTLICTHTLNLDALDVSAARGDVFQQVKLTSYPFPHSFTTEPTVRGSFGGSDNTTLRNGVIGLSFYRGRTPGAGSGWDRPELISATSATASVGENTRIFLLAIGRWF